MAKRCGQRGSRPMIGPVVVDGGHTRLGFRVYHDKLRPRAHQGAEYTVPDRYGLGERTLHIPVPVCLLFKCKCALCSIQ